MKRKSVKHSLANGNSECWPLGSCKDGESIRNDPLTPNYQGKLVCLHVELLCLQLSFFALQSVEVFSRTEPHCTQKSFNCKQKGSNCKGEASNCKQKVASSRKTFENSYSEMNFARKFLKMPFILGDFEGAKSLRNYEKLSGNFFLRILCQRVFQVIVV